MKYSNQECWITIVLCRFNEGRLCKLWKPINEIHDRDHKFLAYFYS